MVRRNSLLPPPDEPLTGRALRVVVAALSIIVLLDLGFAFTYRGGHTKRVATAGQRSRAGSPGAKADAGASGATSSGEVALTPTAPAPVGGSSSTTDTPSPVPGAGPSGKLYPVTQDQPIRSSPAQSASPLGTVPNGTAVGVQCKARGEVVTGPYGPDPYWDKVIFGNALGYLSDEYVDTKGDEKNDTLVPPC